MKNYFFRFSLFLIFAQIFCFSSVLAAETDLKTVRVGVYDNNPKIYRDVDGNIKGFWADITNYIAQKENWNLIYVYGTWDEGLARLKNNEIDLMVDVGVSDERKLLYDFNKESAFLSWSMIYTRKGFEIKSFKDLEGKNIAIMKSSVHYTAPLGLKNVLNSFGISSNLIDAANMEDIFKLLDTNQADAGVVNWNFGISNEERFNVVRTGLIFNPSELNYAMPKNGPKNNYLTSVIDFHLREIKNDPDSIYYKSISENFGKFLGQIEVQVLPSWLSTFLIIAGVVLAIMFATMLLMRQYQKSLKREIDSRIHEIKENEEKYSAVVNQAQDGIVIIQDQIIKYANKAIGFIGYTSEEVLGKPFIDLVVPEEQKRISETYKKKVAGEKVDTIFETKLFHKNGSVVDIEFSSGIINYGNMPAVLVMVRDITERKKLENEIRMRNAILSTELEVSADGVLVADGKGKIILYNKKFINMWGISKEAVDSKSDELALKSVTNLLANPKEFLDRVNYLYEHRTETDEREIELNDGRSFARYSAPMFGEGGEYYGRVWYFRDITEKKTEEKKIVQLEQAKSEFISIAAHQLKNPIASIKGASGLVLKGDVSNLTDDQKDFLDIVNKGSEQMNELVNFLLKISRAEAGKVQFALSPVNLDEVTSSVLANYKDEINKKSIKVNVSKNPDPLPYVFMDKDALIQVVSNLVSNAINYSFEKSEITLSMIWTGDAVEYSVKDTGIGIPVKDHPKIFEKFYRADNARSAIRTGTGLGLALAMTLVKAWGGKIWFESEENKGTTFHITVPVIGKKEVKGEII